LGSLQAQPGGGASVSEVLDWVHDDRPLKAVVEQARALPEARQKEPAEIIRLLLGQCGKIPVISF
jgi:hypothetical protein